MRLHKICACSVALLLLACLAAPAAAFQVQPMSYTLEPVGSGARTTLRIQNTFQQRIAIELSAMRRSMDEAGNLIEEPADDDFVLFPPQTFIEPGRSQAVRVQYVGEPQLEASRSYTIALRQLPVRVADEDAAAVQMVVTYGTAAHVIPRGARADVHVESVSASTDGEWLTVELVNRGNRLANLYDATWTLRNGGADARVLEPELLESAIANPMIFPDGRRRIELPAPADWQATGQLDLRLRF